MTSSAGSSRKRASRKRGGTQRVRYAVVGLGYIAQVAVLPAFAHARANSELVALISDEPRKRGRLAKRYGAPRAYGYDHYQECLQSGEVDAVFIALPNSMHCDFAVRAARAGVHVLCEKPMAVTEEECERMIAAAERHDVRLMIGYRLHFEPANLEAVELARGRKLGDVRIFESLFTMQVKDRGNIRLKASLGGGVLYDIGIYCVNAARYLFRAEPYEVFAWSATNEDRRFAEVDEMTSAILRFPGERLASFTASFGAASVESYRVVGTRGDLRLEHAYEYAEPIERTLTVGDRTRRKRYPKLDQFAAELVYFSDCVQRKRKPEPSGEEGLADVRIIRALQRSIEARAPIALDTIGSVRGPTVAQEIRRPPVRKPRLIGVRSPSGS